MMGRTDSHDAPGILLVVLVMALTNWAPSEGSCDTLLPPVTWTQLLQIDQEITRLISTLRWSCVTLFVDHATGFPEYLVNRLHGSHISTAVCHNVTMVTTETFLETFECGFVVMGRPVFVKTVFTEASKYAELTNQRSALFTSEWLTLATEVDVQHIQPVFNQFENIAVIVSAKTGLSLWTVLHVRDDSRLSFVTSLPSTTSPSLPRRRILPNRSSGLGGRTLRVAVKETTYFVRKNNQNDTSPYEGVSIELLKELSLRLNFSYTFVAPPDDSWGQELHDGQWDGPIGMLTRKEADLAVSTFTITQGRSEVADPSAAYLYDNVVVMFISQGGWGSTWGLYLRPFHPSVYPVVAGCLLWVLLLLLVLERCHEGVTRHPAPATRRGSRLQWLLGRGEIVLAGLLARPTDEESASRAGRVLVLTWLVVGVLLTSAFSSQLTSSLTVRHRTLPFTSLSGLLAQDTYTWGFQGSGSNSQFLKNSNVPELQQFYQGAQRFAQTDPSVLSSDVSVQLAKVAQGNYALFGTDVVDYSVMAARRCDVEKLPDVKMTMANGFYLQKGSPYTKYLSDGINRMVDSGLVDYWLRKWTPVRRKCELDGDQSGGRVISLTDTQTGFYLAAAGLGVAAFALWLERLFGGTV